VTVKHRKADREHVKPISTTQSFHGFVG